MYKCVKSFNESPKFAHQKLDNPILVAKTTYQGDVYSYYAKRLEDGNWELLYYANGKEDKSREGVYRIHDSAASLFAQVYADLYYELEGNWKQEGQYIWFAEYDEITDEIYPV